MRTRMMDLVMLVAEMTRGAEWRPHELARRGYSSDEIDQAVLWVSSRPRVPRARHRRPGTTRVLSEFERMSVSAEAYDFLLRLERLGIVDAEQFETILTRSIPVGAEKVHVDDVKGIACAVIFDREAGDLEEEALDRFDADGAPV